MRKGVGDCLLELTLGDITRQQVDAIVNAANAQLAGGGGVDGAIHSAAGPSVMDETVTRYPEGCPPGSAVATGAGNLSARFIFHAVGPRWRGGRQGEPDLLRSACRTCLALALENDCRSIAFPAISTGIYGYPMDQAARASLTAVIEFLREHNAPPLVRFVLFGEGAFGAFSRTLDEILDT